MALTLISKKLKNPRHRTDEQVYAHTMETPNRNRLLPLQSAGRGAGSWLSRVRGHEQRPRPADETGSCEWLRSRGAACGRNSRDGAGAAVQIYKRAATRAVNLGNGNPKLRSVTVYGPLRRLRRHLSRTRERL